MKIGILTLPLHTNYGGILQAYALQTVLERMGHEVVVFNKRASFNVLPLWKRPIYYGVRLLKKLFLDHHIVIRREYVEKKEYPIISQYVQQFIDTYIHCCWIDKLAEIKENDFDAFVVGSDQIWRPKYFANMWGDDLTEAFLSFTEGRNCKRYAYAASFGVDEWEFPEEITERLKNAADKFDAISVREKSGVALCKNKLNCKANHVLDPTMLLKKEDYIKLIENAHQTKSEGNLFCYILNKTAEMENFISRVAAERNLIPFHVKAESQDSSQPINKRTHKPVEAWLRAFYDAKFIITDSFHACVFAILFEKPFIVVGNKSGGLSRFSSLMDMFAITDNLLENVNEYNSSLAYTVPAETLSRLDELRKYSMAFLQQINN